MSSAAYYTGRIMVAAVTKLSSSVDDVIWLTPFLSEKTSTCQKSLNTSLYLLINLVVVGISVGLSRGGITALNYILGDPGANAYWDAQRVLGLVSALSLGFFATYLFMFDNDDDDDDEAVNALDDDGELLTEEAPANSDLLDDDYDPCAEVNAVINRIKRAVHSGTSENAEQFVTISPEITKQPTPAKENPQADTSFKGRTLDLLCIGFLGSLDELIIQSSLLISGVFDYTQLATGTLLGAIVVVMICLFISRLQCIARLFESVPLYVIVMILAVVTLVNTFLEFFGSANSSLIDAARALHS